MLIVAAMIWESLMGGGGGWEWRPPYLGRGECAVQSADGGLTARSVAQSARVLVRPLSTPRPPHRRPAVAISRAPQTGNLISKQPHKPRAEEKKASRSEGSSELLPNHFLLESRSANHQLCVGIQRSLKPHLVKTSECEPQLKSLKITVNVIVASKHFLLQR